MWAAYIGDATDRLDVAASASKVSTAFLALAPLYGKQVQPVTGAAKAISEIMDPKGLDAFNRLQRRSQHASCDFWQLLWGKDAAAWENCIKQSFKQTNKQTLLTTPLHLISCLTLVARPVRAVIRWNSSG